MRSKSKKIYLVLTVILFAFGGTMIGIAATPTTSGSTNLTNALLVSTLMEKQSQPDASFVNSKYYTGNGNNLNLGLLQVGDIIAVSGVKMGDSLMPGHYTHTAIYIGGGLIVEAMPEGVRYSYDDIVHGADDAAIIRVSGASSSQKQAAADFCEAQVGKPYDWIWLTYFGGKDKNSYYWYCSELNWAGYKHQGIDIDRYTGWSWKYGYNVAPQELVDDYDTWIVATAY